MAGISLSSYTLRVSDGEGNNKLINDFDGNGADIYEILKDYLDDRENNCCNDAEKRKFLKVSHFSQDNRIINGIIETGDYGYESNIYDINDEVVSYQRKAYEADMLPFYFLLKLNENYDEGLVLLQRFKQFGIRGTFLDDFNNFFTSYYPEFKIEIKPLVPDQIVRKYLEDGRITKLRFIRFQMPSDFEDFYENQDHVEEMGSTELVVSAKSNSSLPVLNRITTFLNGEIELTELIELQDYDYDNVKAEVVINKKSKVIDLGNLNKIMPYYDITDEVVLDENSGHPLFDSIDRVSRDFMTDLYNSIRERVNE